MRVTHDLRTPLTAIRGHAAALSDGVVPEDDVPRSLAAIEGEAARLETLVADLLDLARLDAHRFKLDLARVDPGDVLDRAFDAMEAEAAARGVAYERRIDAHALGGDRRDPGAADRRQPARQRAALDAGRAGRCAWRAPPLADGGFAVAVSDTGPGVPDRDRERIFDAFQSLETPDGRPRQRPRPGDQPPARPGPRRRRPGGEPGRGRAAASCSSCPPRAPPRRRGPPRRSGQPLGVSWTRT